MKRFAVAACALVAAGCGYIGEPLPPLVNIPSHVTDLAAVQHGGNIVVQFTVPRLTTEGVIMRRPAKLDLRAGPGLQPFSVDAWFAGASDYGAAPVHDGRARYEIQATPWTGKEIVVGARLTGSNGRESAWSNFVVLTVVPPPEVPRDLHAEAVPKGVRVTWQAAGSTFRIFRREESEKEFARVGTADKPEWLDKATQYGKTYHFVVQTVVKAGAGEAESELSAETALTPEDRFPPAVPTGLKAAASASGIELLWDRGTDADVAGYRVYRAVAGGAFERIADTQPAPTFSDRKVQPGAAYRYAVTAVDTRGNESAQSAQVEITAR